MAGKLLFDLEVLDLNAVAITPDEIGRMNPQAGAMRQLDHLVWMNPECSAGLGVKRVRHDEFWVECHIPGRPLMPGVLMIEAAAQLCSIIYKCRTTNAGFLGFVRCDNVVFRGQVVPGDSLYLLGKEVKLNARRIISDVQAVVNNNLVFEGQITGMIV